jgi:hypothetical protein
MALAVYTMYTKACNYLNVQVVTAFHMCTKITDPTLFLCTKFTDPTIRRVHRIGWKEVGIEKTDFSVGF